MKKLAKTLLVCGLGALLARPASALEMRPILTLEVARKIVEACIAKAQHEGWKMHVAVLDTGGNLKAFARMHDAQLISEELAMRKPTPQRRCRARPARPRTSPTGTRSGGRVVSPSCRGSRSSRGACRS